MNSIQIENALHRIFSSKKYTTGVYAADELVKVKYKVPLAIIFNTAPRNKLGEHWIAVLKKNHTSPIEFFCSLGSLPKNQHDSVKQWLKSIIDNKIIFNSRPIQGLCSSICGVYCLLFLLLRKNNVYTFNQFLNLFSPINLRSNDVFAFSLLERKLPDFIDPAFSKSDLQLIVREEKKCVINLLM